MKILLPDNIFARILSSAFTVEDKKELRHYPSSLLSKNAIETEDSVALIPTLDLLSHKDFFISRSVGISFDEPISNSYLYFNREEKNIKEIVLSGDISSNEAILTKILFSETYGIDIQLSIEKPNGGSSSKNRILVGDGNFMEDNLNSAISFTEEMIELTSAPYVNFVFASESENVLKNFHSKYRDTISTLNSTEVFGDLTENFSIISKNYLTQNLQHVVFDFDEQDLEGIKRLLELPFYHCLIQDMIEVKSV